MCALAESFGGGAYEVMPDGAKFSVLSLKEESCHETSTKLLKLHTEYGTTTQQGTTDACRNIPDGVRPRSHSTGVDLAHL